MGSSTIQEYFSALYSPPAQGDQKQRSAELLPADTQPELHMYALNCWGRRMVVAAAAFALTGASAGAQSWFTSMNGANESPPVVSAGTGFARFTLLGSVLTIEGSFTGLTGNTTVAHIHCCTAAALAGTVGVATTTPTFVGFPVGVTSGTFLLTLDLTQASSYNAAFVTANGGIDGARAALLGGMNNGRSYLNIHSSFSPSGEIRGFISVVPEPSSMVLLGTGLLGLAGMVTRRRRAGATSASAS